MTLPGSVRQKLQVAQGSPLSWILFYHLQEFWGQREADGGGYSLGVLTGPKGTPEFSYSTSIKRSTFYVL